MTEADTTSTSPELDGEDETGAPSEDLDVTSLPDLSAASSFSRMADIVGQIGPSASVASAINRAGYSPKIDFLPKVDFMPPSSLSKIADIVARTGPSASLAAAINRAGYSPKINFLPKVDFTPKIGFLPKVDFTPKIDFLPKVDFMPPSSLSKIADIVGRTGPSAHLSALARIHYPQLDLGTSRTFSALMRQIRELDLERLHERFRPRNLRAERHDVAELEGLMRQEGLPFCLVPDGETVGLLLAAEDRSSRCRVLIERAGPIFQACDEVVGLCVNAELPEHGVFIRKAISAYGDGHPEAAQALATVVMDRLVGMYKHQGQIKNSTEGVTFIESRPWREWFFLLPIPVIHNKIRVLTDLDAFNRNATVHLRPAQLSASNAVQAIMLATSMLGFHQDLW